MSLGGKFMGLIFDHWFDDEDEKKDENESGELTTERMRNLIMGSEMCRKDKNCCGL
jgi:hypothetical protein